MLSAISASMQKVSSWHRLLEGVSAAYAQCHAVTELEVDAQRCSAILLHTLACCLSPGLSSNSSQSWRQCAVSTEAGKF